MRISDWSSDVCSSDLQHQLFALVVGGDQLALALLKLAIGLGKARHQQAEPARKGEKLAGRIGNVHRLLRLPQRVEQDVGHARDEDGGDEDVEWSALADEERGGGEVGGGNRHGEVDEAVGLADELRPAVDGQGEARKSVVQGKSGAVSVEVG